MPILGYWGTRSLAQSIRFLLHYVGEEYEEKAYIVGPGPEFNKDCWYKEKYNLGLDFPNLPYYIDGDVKITQSNAILRYIARKHDMCGSTEEERIAVDILENQLMDFHQDFFRLVMSPDFDTVKPAFLKDLQTRTLRQLSDYLGDKPWFAGEKVTFPDCHAYELLYQLRGLAPDCLSGFQNLKDYMLRFESLDGISKYMKSDQYKKWPIGNKYYKFGATQY